MYVVDNGLEFHSTIYVNAALELNTDIQYRPVRQPWFKPSIEHFFRELGFNLPAEGKVQKPLGIIYRSIPQNPQESHSRALQRIAKVLCRRLSHKINSKTLEIPFDLFKESFESTPPASSNESTKSWSYRCTSKTLSVGNEGCD
jgi:putative transposase